MALTDSPRNGNMPIKRACRRTPAPQTSTFSEYVPAKTSGAIYEGLPTTPDKD